MQQFIAEYGAWVGLTIYFLYKEVWPLVRDKLIPAGLRADRDEREARLKDLEEDRSFFRELERERMNSFSKMVEALQAQGTNLVQVNERIGMMLTNQQTILARQESTFAVLTDGIADMRVAQAARDATKAERRRKSKRSREA